MELDFKPPDTLPDIANLRLMVLEQLWGNPLESWSKVERAALQAILYDRVRDLAKAHRLQNEDFLDRPGVLIMVRDIEEVTYEIPKWVMLAGWLTHESAAGYEPETVALIANLALQHRLDAYVPRHTRRTKS